jgi:hypothetical protein
MFVPLRLSGGGIDQRAAIVRTDPHGGLKCGDQAEGERPYGISRRRNREGSTDRLE